ncbi:MAG: hypothetical protein D6679_10395, partial [Candidatus Hydrogenedentota bacterium]
YLLWHHVSPLLGETSDMIGEAERWSSTNPFLQAGCVVFRFTFFVSFSLPEVGEPALQIRQARCLPAGMKTLLETAMVSKRRTSAPHCFSARKMPAAAEMALFAGLCSGREARGPRRRFPLLR